MSHFRFIPEISMQLLQLLLQFQLQSALNHNTISVMMRIFGKAECLGNAHPIHAPILHGLERLI